MEEYKLKKPLKKLGEKQFAEDIKNYIKASHEFYSSRVPELKVLANKLHEEHSLKEFYKLFNKFWNSGNPKEVSLAIYSLQLYKEDFDLDTWKFIKTKFKELRSWDKVDAIAIGIVGEILIKHPNIQNEIISYAKGKNMWLKRLALMSTIPLVKNKQFKLAITIIDMHLYNKSEYIHKAIGSVLKEIGDEDPEYLTKYILKNINMPLPIFFYATENMRELRRLRELPRPGINNIERFMFWINGK
jgi:3-methyladenine DNA glycosylase AlkD